MVSGKPKPNIIWRKDGRQLYEGRKYKMSVRADGAATLVVNNCNADDIGDYMIDVSNEHGSDKKTASLTVQCK